MEESLFLGARELARHRKKKAKDSYKSSKGKFQTKKSILVCKNYYYICFLMYTPKLNLFYCLVIEEIGHIGHIYTKKMFLIYTYPRIVE